MAERQETSVMVSIQEILRDAQSREEQEKLDAERRAHEAEMQRLEESRRKQEEEAARVRADEEARQRRLFEDQKRQAELNALQEAAIQRARAEAESQARLAEMAARQEHERQLHALSQDKHKKRLQTIAILLGLFFFIGAIGAGVAIKSAIDKANAAEARSRQLESDKDIIEQQQARMKQDLANAKDPEEIARLERKVREAEDKIRTVTAQIEQTRGHAAPAPAGGGGAAVKPQGGGGGGGGGKPCNCTPGDPLCSCL
ncbi:MAG: hypothetical protein M3O50_02945 [Myxococcota bacterium]|nr:hypothetical protein [Myxococcota bacterium]